MPKLSGFEVLKRVKADPGTASIPVIVLSNLSQDSDRRQVLDSGAAEYLVKANMTLHEVIERIEAVLKKGGAQ
jgi:two-component system, OmpR family, phosphate regulon response regulator PhoB